MRVAHLVQQHQRLLELGNPALEHLFTEGGRANRAAKERENPSRVTGTSGGSEERDATQPLRDKEEGLASVEVEANRGAVPLHEWHDVECSREVPRRAHQETKLESMYAVASVHNNSQSTV